MKNKRHGLECDVWYALFALECIALHRVAFHTKSQKHSVAYQFLPEQLMRLYCASTGLSDVKSAGRRR